MLQEEMKLLEKLENLKKFRSAQTGFSIEFPIDSLTDIINSASEIRRKMCFTNAQVDLTKYCNSLKKVESEAKELISEFNGTMGDLNLEMTTVEEVPSIISNNISDFLDEKSTETVLFRLKNMDESERNMR